MSESDESNMPPFIGLARPQSVNETMGHRSYYELQRRVADLEAECGALANPETLPCGHHHSLMLKSAETGEPLYCELCDCISRKNDFETDLSETKAFVAALQGLHAGDVETLKAERDALRAAWETAKRQNSHDMLLSGDEIHQHNEAIWIAGGRK